MKPEVTIQIWESWRKRMLKRMEESAAALRDNGIRIVTEFDEALRAQDRRDEANEWPMKWGGF